MLRPLLFLLVFCSSTRSDKYDHLPHRDDVIYWKDGYCHPKEACQGVDIRTIPYILEHVTPAFVTFRNHKLYDQARTETCLRDRNILILGDSVSEELVFDIGTLLSGIGKYPDDFDKFIINKAGDMDPTLTNITLKIPNSKLSIRFDHGRRNVTLIDSWAHVRVRHRFTGHAHLSGNDLGIQTFFRPEFQEELDCLLGFSDDHINCPKPDTIIFNSGLHDPRGNAFYNNAFEDSLVKLVKMWKQRYASLRKGNVNFIFKGNTGLGPEDGPKMEKLNEISERVMNYFDLSFVDISNVTAYVPRFSKYLKYPFGGLRMYTPEGVHFGTIARHSHGANEGIGTISMLITQCILQELCDNIKSKHANGDSSYGLLVKNKDWDKYHFQ